VIATTSADRFFIVNSTVAFADVRTVRNRAAEGPGTIADVGGDLDLPGDDVETHLVSAVPGRQGGDVGQHRHVLPDDRRSGVGIFENLRLGHAVGAAIDLELRNGRGPGEARGEAQQRGSPKGVA
jgi:hypothetical protein